MENLVHTYNIKGTYVDEDDPWLGILVAAAFTIHSLENRLKCYSPCQLIFGLDMIQPINHIIYL